MKIEHRQALIYLSCLVGLVVLLVLTYCILRWLCRNGVRRVPKRPTPEYMDSSCYESELDNMLDTYRSPHTVDQNDENKKKQPTYSTTENINMINKQNQVTRERVFSNLSQSCALLDEPEITSDPMEPKSKTRSKSLSIFAFPRPSSSSNSDKSQGSVVKIKKDKKLSKKRSLSTTTDPDKGRHKPAKKRSHSVFEEKLCFSNMKSTIEKKRADNASIEGTISYSAKNGRSSPSTDIETSTIPYQQSSTRINCLPNLELGLNIHYDGRQVSVSVQHVRNLLDVQYGGPSRLQFIFQLHSINHDSNSDSNEIRSKFIEFRNALPTTQPLPRMQFADAVTWDELLRRRIGVVVNGLRIQKKLKYAYLLGEARLDMYHVTFDCHGNAQAGLSMTSRHLEKEG